MNIKVTMHTPQSEIGENAKICYATKSLENGGTDITTQLVHGHSHLAALRFAYATVAVNEISVACQNQIVRSKHLDFMVQSKRYVSDKKGNFKFIMPKQLDAYAKKRMELHWNLSIELYNDLINEYKVKKEDARAILPANTSTNMNITGSLQSWWDFFKLRMNTKAQTEIREVATEIFDKLSIYFPKVFTEDTREKMIAGKY